jgi:hypothetical protein
MMLTPPFALGAWPTQGCPELSSFAAAGCTRLTREALLVFIPTYAEVLRHTSRRAVIFLRF